MNELVTRDTDDFDERRRSGNNLPTSRSRTADLRAPIRVPACNVSGFNRRWCVDKNRVEGSKHEVKGAVKEGVGKVTGDHVKEAAGKLEKNAGKLQKEVGKATDEARKSKH
jgi:uncharacterized protein YjbJ (UPF0337 family)